MIELHMGFTGTERGMTPRQEAAVRAWLETLRWASRPRPELGIAGRAVVGHHGDCVGADEEFHRICREMGFEVDVHPPDNPRRRAFCMDFRRRYPEKPYLARNRDIARCSSVLVAAPHEAQEVVRSGTWATVRAATALDRAVIIYLPDGSPAHYEGVRIR